MLLRGDPNRRVGNSPASVRTLGCAASELNLVVRPGGTWWQDGNERPDLTGCVDVDISATPLTNTFPLQRVGDLGVGKSVSLPVAWVDAYSLDVERVPQTYTRLTDRAGFHV